MSPSTIAIRFLFSTAFALLACTSASAQGVIKCTVNGKTVYQATPCEAGDGKAVSIQSGPSEQDVQAARDRANADKAKVHSLQAPPPAQPSAQLPDKFAPRKVDCAQLDKQRGELIGRRNGVMKESRKTNFDESAKVDGYNADIRRIEGQMAQGGCKTS